MKYKDYNDFELISYVKEQIEEAYEILIEKYMPLIKKEAYIIYSRYKSLNLEYEDLINQGLCGLLKAVTTYKDNNALFYTYACRCITREMNEIIKYEGRLKNKILNESITYDDLEYDIYSDDKNILLSMIDKENISLLKKHLINNLSKLEYKVFEYKILGYSNIEISEKMNRDIKTIENALVRVRIKLKKYNINKTLT